MLSSRCRACRVELAPPRTGGVDIGQGVSRADDDRRALIANDVLDPALGLDVLALVDYRLGVAARKLSENQGGSS